MSIRPEQRPSRTPQHRRVWVQELLFGAGMLLALALLLRPGLCFFGFPEGSDWETYISNTAHIWHGDWPDVIYQDWRKPLHGYLVGLLGEPSSYIHGAQLLTTSSVVAMVLGAGLLGRALATRAAGVVSAVSVAALSTLEPASRWVNHYPLLAGSSALALGLGAACLRWPRGGWALAAGLLAGLCFAVDGRGLVVPFAVGLLVVGAALSVRAQPRRAATVALLGLLGMGVATAVDLGLQHSYTPGLLGVADQLGNQRQVILTHYESVGGAPEQLDRACRLDEPGAIDTLSLPCAVALERENHRRMRARGDQPPAVFGLLLLLALVPGRRGWRDSLGGLAVFGSSAVALVAGMAWVVYWDRYGLQLTVPLAALAPVALWRLAQLITARAGARWPGWSRSLTAAASALAVAGLVWPGWPGSEGEVRPTGAQELRSGGEDGRLQLAAWVRAQVGEDDLIIDCAGASLFQLLLPLRLQLLRAPSHTPSCQSWGRAPPSASGRLWFVTLEPAAGHDDRFGLPPAWMAAHGWQPWPLELEPLADGARLRVWSRERASEQP